jgi:hypothetical protein
LTVSFLAGPPRYAPRGQWHPLHAVIVTLVIVIAALAVGVGAAYLGLPALFDMSPSDFAEQYENLTSLAGLALLMPIIGGLTWFAAGLLGDRPREVLQLDGPLPSAKDAIAAVAGYTLLYSVFVTFRYAINAGEFITAYRSDNQPYLAALHEPYWPLVIVALPGMAFVSELLFQGFLASGVAKLRWGFWGLVVTAGVALSAAVATSVAGAMQDFVMIVYASWLTWRSGRLWLAVICEMWASTILFAVLAFSAWG